MAGGWRILYLHQRMWSLWSGMHNALRADSLEGGRWAIGWCCCFLIHSVFTRCQRRSGWSGPSVKIDVWGDAVDVFNLGFNAIRKRCDATCMNVLNIRCFDFFYIKSKMWSYCLANSHLRVLFAWICMSLFAFCLQSSFLLGAYLTNTVLSICFI